MEVTSPSEGIDVRKAYDEFDTNRPPFCFPTREPNYQPDHPYHEVDETHLFEIENRIFHPEDFFPRPPEGLAPEHPVKKAWEAMLEAHQNLMDGVELIKSIKQFLRDPRTREGEPLSPEVLGVLLGHPLPEQAGEKRKKQLEKYEKRNRRNHLREKKEYFQRALTYLYLCKNCPDLPKNEGIDELLDETELIYLGHITYAVVRSGAHKFGAVREDGTLVMDHCYKTCVFVINRYLEELRREKDPRKRRKLYNQAKKGIIVALSHDYLEDFEKLSEGFFEDKMTEHTTWDTDIEGDLRDPGYTGIPKRSNFFARQKTPILRMLDALNKPRPKGNPKRKGYLRRQLLDEFKGSVDDQILAFRAKVGDRLHNQRTVGVKPPNKQADYMLETGEIIDLGREIAQKIRAQRKLAGDLLDLSSTTLEISANLLVASNQLNPEMRTALENEVIRIRGLLGEFLSHECFRDLMED